ncbi:hypothetical protein BDV93DRAFT_510649 [Ceratobasidium sp. AG-I]|nr:hypothetical protein BDV93DRAFT_510649 [Ceratobasidium sp. AG-I]
MAEKGLDQLRIHQRQQPQTLNYVSCNVQDRSTPLDPVHAGTRGPLVEHERALTVPPALAPLAYSRSMSIAPGTPSNAGRECQEPFQLDWWVFVTGDGVVELCFKRTRGLLIESVGGEHHKRARTIVYDTRAPETRVRTEWACAGVQSPQIGGVSERLDFQAEVKSRGY